MNKPSLLLSTQLFAQHNNLCLIVLGVCPFFFVLLTTGTYFYFLFILHSIPPPTFQLHQNQIVPKHLLPFACQKKFIFPIFQRSRNRMGHAKIFAKLFITYAHASTKSITFLALF